MSTDHERFPPVVLVASLTRVAMSRHAAAGDHLEAIRHLSLLRATQEKHSWISRYFSEEDEALVKANYIELSSSGVPLDRDVRTRCADAVRAARDLMIQLNLLPDPTRPIPMPIPVVPV